MEKIYEKKCEHCGKIIKSLSESQAQYNYEAHKISCIKKRKIMGKK